jgi:hypothetical protein
MASVSATDENAAKKLRSMANSSGLINLVLVYMMDSRNDSS